MGKYTDIHCHILPGVDDGAQTMEETRRMLKLASEEGIRYIVATPHHHPRRGKEPPEVLKKQYAKVRREAREIDEKLKVFLGTEVYFGQDVPDKLREKRILTMNETRFVLAEFSPGDSYDYIRQSLQQIQMKGYEVILAHIERYECMRDDIYRVGELKEMGVAIQINAGSIIGESGRKIKKYIKNLLKEELVDCVGTDAHGADVRPPKMKKAAEYVRKKYGEDYMRRIFFSNAVEILRRREER